MGTVFEHIERGPQANLKWVRELMIEMGVLALPREIGLLGRALDSRDFWNEFNLKLGVPSEHTGPLTK